MAQEVKMEIGNRVGVAQATERQEQIKWLQPDGVASPITNAKIRALIGEGAGV